MAASTAHLRDLLANCAANYPLETAYFNRSHRRTWAELDARSSHLLGAAQRLGLQKGETFAVMAHNCVELAEHWFTCLKGGLRRMGVNWRYSTREILHVIRDSDARAILVQADCAPVMLDHFEALQAEGRRFVGFGGPHPFELDYDALIAEQLAPQLPELDDADSALIGYTSGSTGHPKGVLLTQAAVRDSALQLSAGHGYTFEDLRLYCTNPAGVNILTACNNVASGMPVLIEDFDVETFFDLVAEHGVTQVTLIPTMLRRIMERLRVSRRDLSSLRQISYGAMPTPPAMIRQAYDLIGCRFMQIYGASEVGGPVTALRDREHRRALRDEPALLASAGRPFPQTRVSIRDEGGRALPPGELGSVWLGGGTVMTEYINRPDETREALPAPGWHRTGDIGRIDERGYIFLGDRRQSMIISGGMNIYPATVEGVIAEHPAVSQVAVVGLPHPDWGEAVAAMVTLWPDQTIGREALIGFCRDRMAGWETPKHIEIVGQMPQGATDKVDKKAVAAMLLASDHLPWSADRRHGAPL